MSEEPKDKKVYVRQNCLTCDTKGKLLVEKLLVYRKKELTCDNCQRTERTAGLDLEHRIFAQTPQLCKLGCGYRARPQDLTVHEDTLCRYRQLIYACAVKDCNVAKTPRGLMEHVKRDHADNFVCIADGNNDRILIGEPKTPQVKLITLYPPEYIKNELYWLRIVAQSEDVIVVVQHVCTIEGNEDAIMDKRTFTKFCVEKFDSSIRRSKKNVLMGQVIVSSVLRPRMKDALIVTELLTDAKQLQVSFIPSLLGGGLSKLSEDLLSNFECEICSEILTAPVRLCANGHSMCDACCQKLTQCAKCAGDLNASSRNYALEKILSQLIVDCKHRGADGNGGGEENGTGCLERLQLKDLQQHTTHHCWFRPYECFSCNAQIPRKDLLAHLGKCYKRAILGVKYAIDLGQFTALNEVRHVFIAYGELFVLHIRAADNKTNAVNGGMRFAVENATGLKKMMAVGEGSSPQYWFDLTVAESGGGGRSITFTAKCGNEEDETKDCDVVALPENYFKRDGELNYVLKIYAKD